MMSLPVEESEFIKCDLIDILRYIRSGNPPAGIRFVEAFRRTVDLLARMPHLGRTRSDLGSPETRSWRVAGFRKYLIFYEALPDRLRLLRVLHGSRDLQTELEK
jgi:toxin ParE1/3/4